MNELRMSIACDWLTASAVCAEGRPLPTVHMVGHALSGPMTAALVICGDAGLEEDLKALKKLGVEWRTVITTPAGLGSGRVPADHLVMIGPGPRELPDVRTRQNPTPLTVHLVGGDLADLGLCGADYRWGFYPPPVPGCPVSAAAHLALGLQADHVILAGIGWDAEWPAEWSDERLTEWRKRSEGLYGGRVLLARSVGPLAPFLLTPIKEK